MDNLIRGAQSFDNLITEERNALLKTASRNEGKFILVEIYIYR